MNLRIGFLLAAESRGFAALHWFRRLLLPMAALSLFAAMPFGGVCLIGLILVLINGGDEPKTLPYANRSNCRKRADGGQSQKMDRHTT